MLDFLSDLNKFLNLFLVIVTTVYVILTGRMVWEMRRAREEESEPRLVATLIPLGATLVKLRNFLAAAEELEPGYQIVRLRMQRGLTQAQLAEMIGTRQPSIARLENGTSLPSLTYPQKTATALNAKIEVRLVPEDQQRVAEL
jgi:DNA-binding XRE family transcriptional regulator